MWCVLTKYYLCQFELSIVHCALIETKYHA
nr:MAG TPA: hypothetical protein [Caudoviricetes sp.]